MAFLRTGLLYAEYIVILWKWKGNVMRRSISNNAELMESLQEWYAVFPQGIHVICA